MKTVMLAVGISQYASPEIDDLPVCHADATAMVALFREITQGNFAELVLLNEQATKANIAAGIAWLAQNTVAADLALFYYSGHGASFKDDANDEADGQEEFLCPYDCGLSIGMDTFIRDDELRQWLSAVSAKTSQVVCMFDSCHSGSATMAATNAIAKEIPAAVVERLIGDDRPPPTPTTNSASVPGQILLAGCQDFEQSFIFPDEEHSVFTSGIIKGLQDSSIRSFQALFAFVYDATEEISDLVGVQQHPNMIDGSNGELIFR